MPKRLVQTESVDGPNLKLIDESEEEFECESSECADSSDEDTGVYRNNSSSTAKPTRLKSPVKAKNDKKEYRAIKLHNGLTAFLIAEPHAGLSDDDESSDSEELDSDDVMTDNESKQGDRDDWDGFEKPLEVTRIHEKMAECRLFVNVGSLNDPPEVPGMARYLQNTIMEGSSNCPQRNFVEFISSCGGWKNVFTESEKTSFAFAVPNKYLRSALDRFASLVTNPLMERKPLGHVRQFVALRENVTDDTLYSELEDFRERYYRAHNMTVVMEARIALDSLEKYCNECFSSLSHEPLPVRYFKTFEPADLVGIVGSRRMYRFDSLDGIDNIEFIWTIPSLHYHNNSKPLDYLAWILEHRGTGSLTSYLRKKCWCRDVFSRIGKTRSNELQFSLSLTLTNEFNNSFQCCSIARALYSYINMIRRDEPAQKRICNEIRKAEDAKRRFSNGGRAVDIVELYKNINFNPALDYPTGTEESPEYDPVAMKACIDMLTPENCNIVIFDKSDKSKSEKVEPWFKTKYEEVEIVKDSIEIWRTMGPMQEYRFPPANPFIAEDFALIPAPKHVFLYPIKIHSDSVSEVWYKAETKAPMPKCYMNFHCISPLPLSSPEEAAMLDMFVMVLNDLLPENFYEVTMAGLYYEIDSSEQGLIVKVNGFNDKLPLLLRRLFDYIRNQASCSISSLLFTETKNKCLEEYRNTCLTNRHKLVEDVRLSVGRLVHWSSADKHLAISDIEFVEFVRYVRVFFDRIRIHCLAQGNMTDTDVISNVQNCVAILKSKALLKGTMPRLRTIEIPRRTRCCRVKNFDPKCGSIVGNYYQFYGASIGLAVMIEMLNMIMSDSSFNASEFVENVEISPMRSNLDVLGYSLMAEFCDENSVDEIDEKIEALRESLHERVQNMSWKEFLGIKKALMKDKTKRRTKVNLREDVKRNWIEITSGKYVFDRLAREIDALRQIKVGGLRKWMINLTAARDDLRKLSVQVVGGTDVETLNGQSNNPAQERRDNNVETGKIGPEESSDSAPPCDHQSIGCLLVYLTDLPEDMAKPDDYFITDIDMYKRQLHFSTVHTSIS